MLEVKFVDDYELYLPADPGTTQLGLLGEIQELWRIAQTTSAGETDFSRGIYQAIGTVISCHILSLRCMELIQPASGYKEFVPYLRGSGSTASIASAREDHRFQAGLEDMKVSTRQYAKRQVKWIKGKLLPAIAKLQDPEDVQVYLLDATGAHSRVVLHR